MKAFCNKADNLRAQVKDWMAFLAQNKYPMTFASLMAFIVVVLPRRSQWRECCFYLASLSQSYDLRNCLPWLVTGSFALRKEVNQDRAKNKNK
jgi:hypothetical protein